MPGALGDLPTKKKVAHRSAKKFIKGVIIIARYHGRKALAKQRKIHYVEC